MQETQGWKQEGQLTREGEAVTECAEALSWSEQPKLVKPEEQSLTGSASLKCPS